MIIYPTLSTFLILLIIFFIWNECFCKRRDGSRKNLFPRATKAGAGFVGIVSIIYSVFDEGRLRHEVLEHELRINGYYEKYHNKHTLSDARAIPKSGLQNIDGQWRMKQTKDDMEEDLVVRFRGVNLPAKTPSIPSQLQSTDASRQFYESKSEISFVNRPFSLEDAHLHFRRISQDWGFNLIRLSVTWEAVMHEGPGIIDHTYLAYLKEFVVLAEKYGLYVIIDPHQDVWSRFTGGDGAPWWTLDVAGFKTDDPALHETGSAVLHQFWNETKILSGDCMDLPKMMWTTNYWRLATSTMFTLFFAGDVYASGVTVDLMDYDIHVSSGKEGTITIQQFLQMNYLEYIDAVAYALKDCPNVIGFGTMNEPSNGFVGVADLAEVHAPTLYGHIVSGFDSMVLASGETLNVPFYPSHFLYHSHVTLNPEKKTAFKSPQHDIWKRVGIYGIHHSTNKPVLLRPNHFSLKDGEDFTQTFLMPFWNSVQEVIRRRNPRFVTFAEPHFDPANPNPNAPASLVDSSSMNRDKFAWAPHWYDAVTLFLGYYSHWLNIDFDWNIPLITPFAIDWAFEKNLRKLVSRRGEDSKRNIYTIVGETGVPHSGSDADYTRSLDRTLRAMEANDLDYIIWCYESENDEFRGDLWNGENLSLISKSGIGRGLSSALRPHYHTHSIGLEAVSQQFDKWSGNYELTVKDSVDCKSCFASIHIFVPSAHYDSDEPIILASGEIRYHRHSQSVEWVLHGRVKGSTHTIRIKK